jgi:hypothetical protein
MPHVGGCLCGSVRYEIASDPTGARMCWCRDCQRIASGSATVNVLFAEADITYTGAISTIELVVDSGNTVERGFCPSCGSQIYSKTLIPDGLPIRVRSGTLDDADLIAPQAIIWAGSAPKWALLDPALPHFPKGPPPALANKTS